MSAHPLGHRQSFHRQDHRRLSSSLTSNNHGRGKTEARRTAANLRPALGDDVAHHPPGHVGILPPDMEEPGAGVCAGFSQPMCRWLSRPPAHADFLFFLSSSTSVHSASTTSSFGPPPPAAPAPPSGPWPPAAFCSACLYIASPSFIDACIKVLVLDLMASASLPFKASLRSASAFSIARRSSSPTFEPC